MEYRTADESTSGTSAARTPVDEESDSEVEDDVAVVELTKVIPSSDCC